MCLFTFKSRNSSLVLIKNKLSKANFANEYWWIKWFCHLLLHYTGIIEFYSRFIWTKGVNILNEVLWESFRIETSYQTTTYEKSNLIWNVVNVSKYVWLSILRKKRIANKIIGPCLNNPLISPNIPEKWRMDYISYPRNTRK